MFFVVAVEREYVDDTWKVEDLKAECASRGMVDYTSLRKAPLINMLNEGAVLSTLYRRDSDERAEL